MRVQNIIMAIGIICGIILTLMVALGDARGRETPSDQEVMLFTPRLLNTCGLRSDFEKNFLAKTNQQTVATGQLLDAKGRATGQVFEITTSDDGRFTLTVIGLHPQGIVTCIQGIGRGFKLTPKM